MRAESITLRQAAPVTRPPRTKVAFLYSSQGAGRPGFGRRLMGTDPAFAAALERADRVIRERLGWSLVDALRPDGDLEALAGHPAAVQPLHTAMQIALTAAVRARGVEADAVAGLCYGELAAAEAAGALSVEQAMRLACAQARTTLRPLPPGALAVVALARDQLGELLAPGGSLHVAVELSAGQTVVAGPASEVASLLEHAERTAVAAVPTPLGRAYHSPEVAPLAPGFLADVGPIRPASARLPFYSSTAAAPLDGSELGLGYWWRHFVRTSRFAPTVARMLADGYESFLEIGPGPMLSDPVESVAAGARRTVSVSVVSADAGDEIAALTAAISGLR
jgi:acyl transferase domain-containing protein